MMRITGMWTGTDRRTMNHTPEDDQERAPEDPVDYGNHD